MTMDALLDKAIAMIGARFPAEVRGDLRFDAMMQHVQQLWAGANPDHANALDVMFREDGIDPEIAWSAMCLGACSALATIYVQRGRESAVEQ